MKCVFQYSDSLFFFWMLQHQTNIWIIDFVYLLESKEPWMVEVPCKDRQKPGQRTSVRVPVILPHELLHWLADNGRFRFDPGLIKQFWERWRQFKPSHPAADAGCHNPIAITGGDAKYTLAGSKIIIIAMSLVLLDRVKARTNDCIYSALNIFIYVLLSIFIMHRMWCVYCNWSRW